MTQTPQSIAAYLDALKAALKGAPPGLVADALADAREHWAEAMAAHPGMSEAQVFAEMAGSYGTPEEVAAEYLAIEMPQPGPFGKTNAPSPAQAASERRPYPGFFGVLKDPVTYGALLYMLLALATGVFYFTWAVTGLSLSAGFLILIIGIPFFLLFIGSVRLISYAEGRLVEVLLGVRMPRRLPALPDGSFWDKVKSVLSDMRTWSSLAYMLLMLPMGIAYFTIAVTGLAVSGGFVIGGVWDVFHAGSNRVVVGGTNNGFQIMENGMYLEFSNMPDWMTPWIHNPVTGLVFVVLGVLGFFLMLHVARLIGWLHGRVAEHLLVRV
jgi:hypothetical protein